MRKAIFLFLCGLYLGGLFSLFSQQNVDVNGGSQVNILEGHNYSMALPQSWREIDEPEYLSQIKNAIGSIENDNIIIKFYSNPQKNNFFMTAESLVPRSISIENIFAEKSVVKKVYNDYEYFTITEVSNNYTSKIACIEHNYILLFFIFFLDDANAEVADQILSSINFKSSEQEYIIEIHYSMLLPQAWREINNPDFLSEFEDEIETIKKEYSIKDLTIKYFSDPVYKNFLFVVDFPIPQGYSLEKRMIKQEAVKTIHNGNEYYTMIKTNDNFTFKSVSIQYNRFLYIFVFMLDDARLDIADQVLSSINFTDAKIEEKTPGFFTGLWHGIRMPFVYIHNLFIKKQIVAFYESGNIEYKIGYYLIYIIAFIAFLSNILNGLRR